MIKQIILFAYLIYFATSKTTFTIDQTELISQQISPFFASFSMEWSYSQLITSQKSFVKLLQNLKQTPNAKGSNLRIGGNSADESWWNPNNEPLSSTCQFSFTDQFCIIYNIQASDFISHNQCVVSVDGSLTYDLVFLQNFTSLWAENQIDAINSLIKWENINALEIGNEPDIFFANGIREPSYNLQMYEQEYQMYLDSIKSMNIIPNKFFQGGTFCCNSAFLDFSFNVANQFKNQLKTWSQHIYPTSTCSGKTVTMQELLDDSSAQGKAQEIQGYVQQINSLGIDFIIGEANSASCGGQYGVSDTLGAALWALDFMFNMANINVHQINFHGGENSAYTWLGDFGNDGKPDVRPLYYAMYIFSIATANYAQIIKLSAGQKNNNNVKVWPVKDLYGNIRIIAINKNFQNGNEETVEITLPEIADNTQGELSILEAQKDGVNAKHGIKFANQSFDKSQQGEIVGNYQPQNIKSRGSTFKFQMKPSTAALLTIIKHSSQY